MNWTETADQLLITLWGKGLSLSEVANGMGEQGYAVGRNACVGRKHRLEKRGVVFDTHVPPQAQPRVKKVREPRPPKAKGVQHFDGVDYLKNGGCKAILDKRSGKWNLSMCCGRKRVGDGPYCEHHTRLYTNANRS